MDYRPDVVTIVDQATMHDPLVSVCLPAYNSEAYIEATIRSVVSQTYTNWELLVADDCSADRTQTIVEAMIGNLGDLRIKFSANPVRIGMVPNWNHVLEKASGEYIKLLGHDDLLDPDCLAIQVSALKENPGVTVVTCTRRVVGVTGRPVMLRRYFPKTGVYNGLQSIRRCLHSGTNIIGEPVAVMFRAATLGTKRLFEPSVLYATDVDLWLRLLIRGDLYFVAEPKISFRIHRKAMTRNLEAKVVADFFRVVDRMIAAGHFNLTGLRRNWLRWKIRGLGFCRRLIYQFLAER